MREIHFTQDGQFLGRNGLSKAIGLEIDLNKFNGMVIIRPINSKNITGSSFIAVPQGSIPELIDTLRLFLEGGSDTAPDSKGNKIRKIQSIIEEWGMFTTAEVQAESSPVYKSIGKNNFCLVERIERHGVGITQYVHDQEVDDFDLDYSELEEDLIDEILELAENYEVDMEKTNKRCRD
jgi:hypothetical protein